MLPAYRISGQAFDHVKLGDQVGLTVGSRHGYVFRVEMLGGTNGPVGQVGSIPELPGAPVGARELGHVIRRVVRSIEGPGETSAAAGGVYTWTYHLGGNEADDHVRVHLASGLLGVERIIALANRSSRPAIKVKRVGDTAWRFGDLLIVGTGEVIVGIEPASGMSLHALYANDLARLVLDERRAPQVP